ncbi:MAG: hypothetical protein HC824_20225 [Synechococcales cyanobacterium RM1_1_8]|nr:hypothetical protein [Synechococcales cyanobacterium RM1_1_8]
MAPESESGTAPQAANSLDINAQVGRSETTLENAFGTPSAPGLAVPLPNRSIAGDRAVAPAIALPVAGLLPGTPTQPGAVSSAGADFRLAPRPVSPATAQPTAQFSKPAPARDSARAVGAIASTPDQRPSPITSMIARTNPAAKLSLPSIDSLQELIERSTPHRLLALSRAVALSALGEAEQLSEFRILSLNTPSYQQLWRNSSRSDAAFAPVHGFVDYQENIIALPMTWGEQAGDQRGELGRQPVGDRQAQLNATALVVGSALPGTTLEGAAAAPSAP